MKHLVAAFSFLASIFILCLEILTSIPQTLSLLNSLGLGSVLFSYTMETAHVSCKMYIIYEK